MALDVLKGATPGRKLGGKPNSGATNMYPIGNGYASDIGEGDFVKLSAGLINVATNTQACLGVFRSVAFVDSDGKLQVKRNFAASTSSQGGKVVFGGYTQPMAMVCDDPDQTYIMRTTTTSVSAGMIGRSFKVSAIGSVVGGRSQAVLDVSASVGTSGGHMVTIVGLYNGQDSAWGTAPTAVEVKLSNHGFIGEL